MIIIPSRYYVHFNGQYTASVLDPAANVAMVDCPCGIRVRLAVETSHTMTTMKVAPAAGVGGAKPVQFFIPSGLRLTFGVDELAASIQARSQDGVSCSSNCLNCQLPIYINWDLFTYGYGPQDPGLVL